LQDEDEEEDEITLEGQVGEEETSNRSSGSHEAKKLDGQLDVGLSHALEDLKSEECGLDACRVIDYPRACAAQRARSVMMCVPKVLWTLAQKVARMGCRRN
jgi:hypothetical protein